MNARKPFLVGLTGGIGSGKTAVSDALGALGAGVVDTDAIAHALTAPGGAAITPLREAFGPEAIAADGRLDRAWMRARAFSDPAERKRLESILHPMIRQAVEDAIAAHAHAPYVLVVVPLLVESGDWRRRVQRVLVVDCEPEAQVTRVMRRSGLTEQQVRDIMSVQAFRDARLAVADDVLRNDGDLPALQAQARTLHDTYVAAAAAWIGQDPPC